MRIFWSEVRHSGWQGGEKGQRASLRAWEFIVGLVLSGRLYALRSCGYYNCRFDTYQKHARTMTVCVRLFVEVYSSQFWNLDRL